MEPNLGASGGVKLSDIIGYLSVRTSRASFLTE